MSFIDEFTDMLVHSVEIAPRIGESSGDPRYGSYLQYAPCQVVEGPIRYRTESGDLVVANGQIVGPPSPVVKADSRVRLMDGRLALVQFSVIYPDEEGPCVQVVYLSSQVHF